MAVLRRFFGILLLLLGLVGVVVCGAAMYHTGSVKNRLLHFVGQVSDNTENAFAGIRHRLEQIDIYLGHVRADLKSVVSSADALGRDGKGDVTEDHIAFTLDHQVKEKLAKAQQLMDSAENTAGAAKDLLALLEGADPVAGENHGGDGSPMAKIEGASSTLSRLPGMLKQARETALDLQENPDSKEALAKLVLEVGEMDKGLAQVQALGREFAMTIQGIENSFRYYREKTFRYVELGGILLPLLLVWLGAGQAALIILGGRLCMRT